MTVNDEDPRLLSVAASVSTGVRVEWDEIQQRAAAREEAEVLRELQAVEKIATFHRAAGSDPKASSHKGEGVEGQLDLQTWGHFVILEQVGAGAFGAVYRASDTKLQREVALKLLWPQKSESSTRSSRVLQEARLLARVRHPNVVTVHGADQIDGQVGLWMEFVSGSTLAEVLRTQGPFSAREAALIGLDLTRALAAVHRKGLLHGDIKAHNVMREQGGRTVLMDFGTGKDLNRELPGDPGQTRSDFAGTPLYLAPEVFDGRARSRAADIYSLGVLLYHLVTDAYPVEGQTKAAVGEAHQRQERHRLRDVRPELPDGFVQIVERALAADPGDRFQSAGAFEAALALFLGSAADTRAGQDAGARRSAVVSLWRDHWVGVTTASLLLIGGGYWAATRGMTRGIPSERPTNTAGVLTAATPSSHTSDSPAALESAYRIGAVMHRRVGDQDVRLRQGDRVTPGDKLSLEVRVSSPTYVYVVEADDQGESYLLFPLPDLQLKNPLSPDQRHHLPGPRNGEEIDWQVSSPGGHEHFLIFANPKPLDGFEQLFAALPRPQMNKPILSARLSQRGIGVLRGVGGLTAESPDRKGPRLTDLFTSPLGDTEETVRGSWVRQVTFDNPIK